MAFLYPTEIFPSEMRALGNGFGVTGWAIGVGWTTLVNPTIFASLANRTYFFFGGLNLLWIPIVYCLYPETKDRSLESLDALFSPWSPWNWKAEKAYLQTMPMTQERILASIAEGSHAGVESHGNEKREAHEIA